MMAYLRVFLLCSVGTLGFVPLISRHLTIHPVVDLQEGPGDVLLVRDLTDQLHHPPLHLMAGGRHLLQKLHVFWMFFTRNHFRQKFTEHLQMSLSDLDICTQLTTLDAVQPCYTSVNNGLGADTLKSLSTSTRC